VVKDNLGDQPRASATESTKPLSAICGTTAPVDDMTLMIIKRTDAGLEGKRAYATCREEAERFFYFYFLFAICYFRSDCQNEKIENRK